MTKIPALASLLAGLFLTAMSITGANAAPQALALVNSDGEVTLQCQEGDCVATLSAYCLQKSRPMPATGTTYEFADAGQVRLVGIRADGSRIVLDASSELQIASLRRQIAVRVAIPKSRLDALGLKAVTVDVGRNVTLLPQAVAGDANPLSESEIALATGPLRERGTRVVESDPNKIGAARWILRLSDTLPRSAVLAPGARVRFLDRARSVDASAGLTTVARDQARGLLDVCQVLTDLGGYGSLRQCFEYQHDSLLWQLNVGYWLADDLGS